MPDFWDADAVAEVLGWLQAHAGLATALGGPGRVSGVLEGPWPRVQVNPSPGGDLRDGRWDTEQEVQLDIVDDPAGTHGSAALWRLAMRAVAAAVEMQDREHVDGQPVVSQVAPSGTAIWSPFETGQGRWQVTVTVVLHP